MGVCWYFETMLTSVFALSTTDLGGKSISVKAFGSDRFAENWREGFQRRTKSNLDISVTVIIITADISTIDSNELMVFIMCHEQFKTMKTKCFGQQNDCTFTSKHKLLLAPITHTYTLTRTHTHTHTNNPPLGVAGAEGFSSWKNNRLSHVSL